MNDAHMVLDRLTAWRDDSRRFPRPLARERARAAMHAALASGTAPVGARSAALRIHPRWRARLTGSVVALAAAAAVVALGWDAPAGSPLFGIRSARQGVQLVLPGADAASLHLQFAEQDLADARVGTDLASSLADAGSQLSSALSALPSDLGSPLWARYEDDQTTLANAEKGIGTASPGEPPRTSAGSPPGATAPGSSAEPSGSDRSPRATGSPRPSGSDDDGSPAPSASGGGGGGGDDGGGGGSDDGGGGDGG